MKFLSVAKRPRVVAILAGLSILSGALVAVGPASATEPFRALRSEPKGVVAPTPDPDFLPDPLSEGEPRTPSRDVATVKRKQALKSGPGAAKPRKLAATDFTRDGYTPKPMAAASLPYHQMAPAPRQDTLLYDSEGVRVFRVKGVLYNHPVAQAQWGLQNLNTYRATRDRFFLDRAIKQAQRNIDRKVESRGAWWYPYDFDFVLCEDVGGVLPAPWYSAMAQGQLLSLFVGLYEATEDEKWREAADATFASLLLEPEDGQPWGSWVDSAGHLWLEEYPRTPVTNSERVLNGHVFAIYGVFDYWRLTKDARAVKLFDGAASTVRHYVPGKFRNPGWLSRYSILCGRTTLGYHPIHVAQTMKLHNMTHVPAFAGFADTLRTDYPAPRIAGNVQLAAGAHVGYRFDKQGRIVAQKTVRLARASSAPADQRIRIEKRGIYFHITRGSLAGWYVTEAFGKRWLPGKVAEHRYSPRRVLTFAAGSYTVYKYAANGKVIGSKRARFYRSSSAPAVASAWVNGRFSYQVSAGAFAGYWVPHNGGTKLG